MKRHYLLLILICLCLSLKAQKQEKCSEKDFHAKKEAYMTEQAGLTQEEAKKFFPLYFELQERKKQINGKVWEKAKKSKEPQTTEAEYEDIVNGFMDAQNKTTALDNEYLKKYKEILSAKKIYLLYRAELKFHRNMLKIIQQKETKEQ